jgi:hypothetical protein
MTMITILQADKNYKKHKDYIFLEKNLENLNKNKNNYFFHVDNENWISYVDLKIFKLLDILKIYDDDQIIMYIDALDTYVVSNDIEIENKFILEDVDILYSAEKGCWPDPNFSFFYEDNFFLNSGTIIFKNRKYQELLEILKNIIDGRPVYNCDQYFHSLFYIILSSGLKIKLDKNNNIFQCLHNENIENFSKINSRILNKNTNTSPCVFHGNGANIGKYNLKLILSMITNIKVVFLNFTSNNNGINFCNISNSIIKVYAEIKRHRDQQVIYSTHLELQPNVDFFITASSDDNYHFSIYENSDILLQVKNF